jgi:hypothetical protein
MWKGWAVMLVRERVKEEEVGGADKRNTSNRLFANGPNRPDGSHRKRAVVFHLE